MAACGRLLLVGVTVIVVVSVILLVREMGCGFIWRQRVVDAAEVVMETDWKWDFGEVCATKQCSEEEVIVENSFRWWQIGGKWWLADGNGLGCTVSVRVVWCRGLLRAVTCGSATKWVTSGGVVVGGQAVLNLGA